MYTYLIGFLLEVFFVIGFLRIKNVQILDNPNDRSSHAVSTPTSGGTVFVIASTIWYIAFASGFHLLFFGLILIATISLIDDILYIKPLPRFIIQVISSVLIYFSVTSEIHWLGFIPILIVLIGWINIYNFMDGINGILVSYSIVLLSSLLYVFYGLDLPFQELIILLISAALALAIFNFRTKAKIFAGDVGAISIAYLLAFLILYLISNTGNYNYLLFGLVYFVDAGFTIFQRLLNGEFIFAPHRKHLYQLLVNECGIKHLYISTAYAILQLFINVLVIQFEGEGGLGILSIGIALFVATLYLLVKSYIYRTYVPQTKGA